MKMEVIQHFDVIKNDNVNKFLTHKNAVDKWKTVLTGVPEHGSDEQILNTVYEIKQNVEDLDDKMENRFEVI